MARWVAKIHHPHTITWSAVMQVTNCVIGWVLTGRASNVVLTCAGRAERLRKSSDRDFTWAFVGTWKCTK
jgi:uncharacterized membrane protein (DUF485 family)